MHWRQPRWPTLHWRWWAVLTELVLIEKSVYCDKKEVQILLKGQGKMILISKENSPWTRIIFLKYLNGESRTFVDFLIWPLSCEDAFWYNQWCLINISFSSFYKYPDINWFDCPKYSKNCSFKKDCQPRVHDQSLSLLLFFLFSRLYRIVD